MPQLIMKDKRWYIVHGDPNLKPGDHVEVQTRRGPRTILVGAHVAHVYEVSEWVEIAERTGPWQDAHTGNPAKPPVKW